MATCTKLGDGEDCDRNYHNRKIVEECPKNLADIEGKKPVYDQRESKSRCLSALGD
jgi:NAD-dependent dihydropyrimidine dehydrogenase PreA subunit